MSSIPFDSLPDRWDVPTLGEAPPPAVPSPPTPAAPGLGVAVVTVAAPTPASAQDLTWVSTHGGAGARTLARVSGGRHVLSKAWPDPALGWPARVVLVARSNTTGIQAVGPFLQEWSRGRVPNVFVVAVAINADAPGRAPRPIRARIAEMSAVTSVITLPWIEAWRADPGTPDRRITNALTSLVGTQRKEQR